MPKTYRVKACWQTLQGEGFFAGRPAVFVRFVGCNMWSGEEADRTRDAARTGAECPLWCDTDFTKTGSTAHTAETLVETMLAVAGPIRFCVLSGGEPFLQADAALIHALHEAGFFVATETNGTLALRSTFWDESAKKIVPPDWIVCSPKQPEAQILLEEMDELKLVVPDYMPQQYKHLAKRVRSRKEMGPLLWLQPEDGPRQAAATQTAVEMALANPTWRVSVQTHKILNIP